MSTASRLWSYVGLIKDHVGAVHIETTARLSVSDEEPTLNDEGPAERRSPAPTRHRARNGRAGPPTAQPRLSSTSVTTDPTASSSQVNPQISCRGSKTCSRFCRVVELSLRLMWALLVTVVVLVYTGLSKLVCDSWRRERDIGNDIVLVTNAGRGLGRRLAVILGTKAAIVVCWDPDTDRQMNTVYDIRHRGGRALGYTVDVADEAAVNTAAKAVRRDVGSPAMIVVSTGRRPKRPLLMWTPRELEAIFRTNVMPHLVLLRTFLPDMITNNYGHVVSIISASALAQCAFDAPYAATKMGVSELMRGLKEELEDQPKNRVKVTCVYPQHTEKRPSLASIAEVVVSKVLRNRSSVVVPRSSIFWMNVLRKLPAPARRRWASFVDRLSSKRHDSRSERLRRGVARGDSWTVLTGATPSSSWSDFLKYAPYEMASHGSLDNVPLHIKKRNSQKFIYIDDNV